MLIKFFGFIYNVFLYFSSRDFFSRVRVQSLKYRGAQIGVGVKVQGSVRLLGCKNIILKDGVFLGEGVRIVAYDEGVTIGENCLVASGCIFITRTHIYESKNTPISSQGYASRRISVGDDVWFGFNCVILPGVSVGTGAIIAANSVVTRDVPSYTVYGGAPARHLRDR